MFESFAALKELFQFVWAFALVLSVLVFFHELGHYLVARLNGVRVEVFSIGFGKELWGWTSASGTRWKLSLIPLGGYVKMFGDANEASLGDDSVYNALSESDKKTAIQSKTPLQKLAIAFAGPFANFVLAYALLAAVFTFYGRINKEPVIGKVELESPAFSAGLRTGDRIISINQKEMKLFREVQSYVQSSAQVPLSLQINRDGMQENMLITPVTKEIRKNFSVGYLGIAPQVHPKTFPQALSESFSAVGDMIVGVFQSLGKVFTSSKNAKELGSVLSIAKISKESLEGGIFMLFSFMAILSVNLGAINLLPIPVLDGGHILIHGLELIIRRPIPFKVQEIMFKIGFGLLILVMAFTLFNDLERFHVVKFVASFFKK